MTGRGFAIPFDGGCGIVSVSAPGASDDVWGKPGMCLFVRIPFIMDPYFQTKGNHQSVHLHRYIVVRAAFMNYAAMDRGSLKSGTEGSLILDTVGCGVASM